MFFNHDWKSSGTNVLNSYSILYSGAIMTRRYLTVFEGGFTWCRSILIRVPWTVGKCTFCLSAKTSMIHYLYLSCLGSVRAPLRAYKQFHLLCSSLYGTGVLYLSTCRARSGACSEQPSAVPCVLLMCGSLFDYVVRIELEEIRLNTPGGV